MRWRRGCCPDGDRRGGGRRTARNHQDGRKEPGSQPWGPDGHRAWRRWTEHSKLEHLQTEPRGRQALPRRGLPGLLPGRGLPGPVPVPWGPEPWGQRGRGPALTDVILLRVPAPWVRRRALLTWQRRRGRRYAASARRGPQWWKRRSERIRPVPAVLSLHLWKLYRALWRAHVRGPWPHFSCLGPHRARHEPSTSYCGPQPLLMRRGPLQSATKLSSLRTHRWELIGFPSDF